MMQFYHVYDLNSGSIVRTVAAVTIADIAANSNGFGVVPAPDGTSDATHRVDLATMTVAPK
jgi:hypothetical protein